MSSQLKSKSAILLGGFSHSSLRIEVIHMCAFIDGDLVNTFNTKIMRAGGNTVSTFFQGKRFCQLFMCLTNEQWILQAFAGFLAEVSHAK